MVAMSLRALLILVPVGHVAAAGEIDVDWKTLTDFTAEFRFDGHNAIAKSSELHQPTPFKYLEGHGTIQADVIGERIKITGVGKAAYSNDPVVPPHVRGLEIDETGYIIFDGPRGLLQMSGKDKLKSGMGPLGLEMCLRVNFPQGLLPPPQYVEAHLSQVEPQVEQAMNQMPHTDTTIDGETVSVYEKTHGPVTEYAGIRHNGSPVGYGIVAPSDGKWEPFIKFPSWTQGAGQIDASAHCAATSVTELLANPDAMKALEKFDNVMMAMKKMTSMQQVLAHFPEQPSLLLKSVAIMEASDANPSASIATQTNALSHVVAIAGVVGAVSGAAAIAIVLAMSKRSVRDTGRVALISDNA